VHVVPICTPPLRDRIEDIPELAEHFILTLSAQLGVRPPQLSSDAFHWLQAQRWPGNVREFRNTIERALILCRDGRVTPELLAGRAEGPAVLDGAFPDPARVGATPISFDLRELGQDAIRRAIEATGGHRGRAAVLLGISERTLRNRLRTH
jgi:DNA-binding NtrC family response regulator